MLLASVQAFKSSFGNMQLSYDWSIRVVDFWAAVVVMNVVVVMLPLLPAASFLQVSVVFVGVSRAQEQGTGRSPSPFPVGKGKLCKISAWVLKFRCTCLNLINSQMLMKMNLGSGLSPDDFASSAVCRKLCFADSKFLWKL